MAISDVGMSDRDGGALISGVYRQGGRQERLGPVMVRFEHGQVNPEAFQRMTPELKYQFPAGDDSPALGATPKFDLKIAADNLVYSSGAKSVKGRMGGNPYQKTLLAIRNKRTKRVRLIETSYVSVGALVEPPPTTNTILLKEEIKAIDQEAAAAAAQDQKDEEEVKDERRAMNKHLVGLFGQTKGRRAYEQADRMAVEANAISDKLNRAAMAVNERDIALPSELATANSADILIPPCNRQAALVNDVYRLEDLLSDEELNQLGQAAEELLENYSTAETIKAGVEGKIFTQMFANHLERLFEKPKTLATAIYMESIVQFVNLRPAAFSQGPRGMKQSHIPLLVKQKLFRDFTSLQGTVSPESRDKAMCYVIVVALIVNSFQADFAELSSSLRVKADQMKRLARLVGATVQTDALTKRSFIVLKLPLASFDVQGSFKKRGGKK